MADPSLVPDGGWWGQGGLVAALLALVASRRAPSRHAMNNAILGAVGPVDVRVAVLEEHTRGVDERLRAMDSKLDRVLDRLDRR